MTPLLDQRLSHPWLAFVFMDRVGYTEVDLRGRFHSSSGQCPLPRRQVGRDRRIKSTRLGIRLGIRQRMLGAPGCIPIGTSDRPDPGNNRPPALLKTATIVDSPRIWEWRAVLTLNCLGYLTPLTLAVLHPKWTSKFLQDTMRNHRTHFVFGYCPAHTEATPAESL